MKKSIFISGVLYLVFCIFITSTTHAKGHGSAGAPPIVNQWIRAMMNKGEGLNAIITPDFRYANYSFEFKKRLFKGKKGDIPFFAKVSGPDEIDIEETIPSPQGGYIVVLSAVSSSGLYRSWEIRLLVRPDGIASVSEIAKEGLFEGFPPGCPETVFKRDLIVTLHGTPAGFSGPKELKLYTFRRDTDAWSYAHPGVDEKMFKFCSPRPDTHLIASEVVALDSDGQIESASTVATKHKAENSERAVGATFFEEDGINFPGRLFNIGGGKEGLLLTFTLEQGHGDRMEKLDPAKLYVWKGNNWKSVWSFDAGCGSTAGFLEGVSGQVEWSLRSTADASGSPTILASLQTNEDQNFNCPLGTTITYTKSGSGFKPVKTGVPGACFKKHNIADGALRAHAGEDKGPVYHGQVKEIDWRFQR